MLKIKFSHPYAKLIGEPGRVIKTAKLLCVHLINLEDQSPDFLSYDTDCGHFQLPKQGQYIMLLFEKPCAGELAGRNLFTTLRPAWPSRKINYYKSKIGMEFEIILP